MTRRLAVGFADTDAQYRIDTAEEAQYAERGALFWLRQRPPVTGAPVAELIRRAIDVYLEQRKAEIKNA